MKHRNPHPCRIAAITLAFCVSAFVLQAAAPPSPQGFITGNAYTDITGGGVANLTGSPKFPGSPDAVEFLPYFEWNATGDIGTAPGNWGDNYGTQIIGYFYPPATTSYYFAICSDDNSVLYLSTDSDPANKKLIARETAYSNPREYLTSAGNSVLLDKLSDGFATSEWPNREADGGIVLQANQPYYIEALAKEGTGGDNLSVSVLGGGIDGNLPIPGQYLSSDKTVGALTITSQPQSQTVDERGSVMFRVYADGTPPYTYQWKRDGADIAGETGLSYTVPSAAVSDDGAVFSVVVTGGQGSATSDDAVLTVAPDTVPPTISSAGAAPSLTEITLSFSEPLDQASATTLANYAVSSSAGVLNVSAATLSGNGTAVTLTTAAMSLGTKYTIIVNGVQDTAATPNTIAADTKAVVVPLGSIEEIDGFIVFEVENYDELLGDFWTRGSDAALDPSGGAYMRLPDNISDNENNDQLLYNVNFAQAATYQVWYRASVGDSVDTGAADSGWFHLNGARPAERDPASGAGANSASMTGFNNQRTFVWRSDSQDGPDPYTVAIPSVGLHVVGIAAREDGAHFDKMILTTDTAFTPTGYGPPETRVGAPASPTVTLTEPTDGAILPAGSDITLAADASGDTVVGIDIVRVQFTANGEVVGEATESPWSAIWADVQDGVYSIQATATDELGVSVTSASIIVEVGTPPPQALLVASSTTLNASDAGIQARLEQMGWQVTVVAAAASVTGDANGKDLVIVSSTVGSGDVNTKFRDVAVPVIQWEQALQDDFLMTLNTADTDRGTAADQTEGNIVNADHPLAAGLSLGTKTLGTVPESFSWGVPGPEAVVIATLVADPTHAIVYGYDTGSTLIDGTTLAPARRVMFLWGDNGYATATEDALALFDAAVIWASGIEPVQKTSARIAWVSFHPDSDTPSTAAASAGFTRAPDAPYTDLLTASGHQVTRVVTSGNPDAALLNAFDLVVISRSVPSGDYQDAPETAAWNGITSPTILLGGYILRNSRLGYTTGGTMVDSTGPITLTVNDPNHPIFAGVELDGANTMINTYADVVEFSGTVQRGVSVNTDLENAEGTVLATVATAADPTVGGMIIGEWNAGATMSNGGADVLGGHRLVLLTGSREASGLTSEGAGIYDLSEDGAKLFLNAVYYMSGTVPGEMRPSLSITPTQTGIEISFTGSLQSADSVDGSWSDVAGATSPWAVETAGQQQFYRAVQ